MSDKKNQVDWAYWTRLDQWKLSEAVCLLLSIDPKSSLGRHVERGSWPSADYSALQRASYSKSRQITGLAWASFHRRKLKMRTSDLGHSTVDPLDWLKWAQSKDLEIPTELQSLLFKRSEEPSRTINEPGPGATASDSVRARRTLLVIIAGLCTKVGIDWNERGVAKRIAGFTEDLGAGVSVDTVRNLLKEIPDALESRQKT